MTLFDNMPKEYIKDFKVGRRMDTCLKVITVDKRTKKDGNPFLTMELMDKTGKIAAKIWNNADTYFKMIKNGSVYRINGVINEYMNNKEIKIEGIKPVAPDDPDYNEKDFVEDAAFDTDALFDQMIHLVKQNVSNQYLLQLTDLFVSRFGDGFRRHYGAQKIHHAYIGGLLEHTHSMMRLAVTIAEHYSLDKDVLLMGVLFHDVGKMFEFSISPAPAATMEGGLVGHIVMGNSIFLELIKNIDGFPPELSIKIQHLIVSHHGEKEFGSPEEPRTKEAYALHIIDMLDSRMAIVSEVLQKNESKGMFTDYVHVLGRRLFVPQDEK